jgi:hypothetical protein
LLSVVVEAVGKPQEKGVMSTAASVPSVGNQGVIDQYEKGVISEGVAG